MYPTSWYYFVVCSIVEQFQWQVCIRIMVVDRSHTIGMFTQCLMDVYFILTMLVKVSFQYLVPNKSYEPLKSAYIIYRYYELRCHVLYCKFRNRISWLQCILLVITSLRNRIWRWNFHQSNQRKFLTLKGVTTCCIHKVSILVGHGYYSRQTRLSRDSETLKKTAHDFDPYTM